MIMEDEAIYEIIQDFLFLYFLVLIEHETKDEELKALLDSANSFYVSIFSHELINSKYCQKELFDSNALAIIRTIRTSYLKNPPIANGKLIKKLKDSTGVDFDNFVFDSVVTVNKNNSNDLMCINFSDFLVYNSFENNAEAFNIITRIPATVVDVFFKALGSDYSIFYNIMKAQMNSIFDYFCERFSFKRYSYSTSLMFKNSAISDEEKYFILYRYNLVKFALLIKELQPISINNCVSISIDTNATYRKIKALAIETIYNDMKKLDFPINEKIKKNISDNIKDSRFFPTNRKLRNNIHYNKRDHLLNDEVDLLDEYQDVYLNSVLDVFNDYIDVSINRNYRFWKWVSEKTDFRFKEKMKQSGYKFMKFEDIFNEDY